MKTTFKINDENFTEHLRLTYGDKQVCFAEETTIEYEPCDELEVSVEQIGAFEYARYKIKNPILRGIVWVLLGLLYIVLVLIILGLLSLLHERGGLRNKNEEYENLSPFNIKSRFRIPEPNGKTIKFKYKTAHFKHPLFKYSEPAITVYNEEVNVVESIVSFNEKKLKYELWDYWLPVMFYAVIFLGVCGFICAKSVISHLGDPVVDQTSILLGVLVFIVILVMLALIFFIVMKSFKKCKLIAQNQMETE